MSDWDAPIPPRRLKLLAALALVLFLQIGGCTYLGGDDFYAMPLFCTASDLTGAAEFSLGIYTIALLLNPLVVMAGFALKRMTLIALIFAALTLCGIVTQNFLLNSEVLHCDAP
ncbi:MAG: hypothetical protein AABZ45_02605 [Pseudomonadota bacterium]